jgi:imidazolonepropionase-like amidohydrolase
MLLLKNGLVIDGKSGKGVQGLSILIQGDRIKRIGPEESAFDEKHARVIDCAGKIIMPGLIDVHEHLIYRDVSDPYSIELAKSLEEATADALLSARELLSYGITTIRDVGTRGNISVVVRDLVKQGKFPGPRIIASGRIISTKGGLADFHPSHIFQDRPYQQGLGELIVGVDEARAAVRQMTKAGVDFIKTECSGTGFNPLCPAERNTLSFQELSEIVDEARENGLFVACHAESYEAVKKAARAPVRTIEHGIYINDEGLDLMAKNGVWLVPTLAMYWGFIEKGPQMGIPQAVIDGHRRTHEFHVKSIQKCMEAGIPIAAGSDAGLVHFPQGGVREEICRYVEIGMTPMEALETATINAAQCIGMDDDLGSLEEGKVADIIVLDADPLEEIECLRDINNLLAVIQNGAIVGGRMMTEN